MIAQTAVARRRGRSTYLPTDPVHRNREQRQRDCGGCGQTYDHARCQYDVDHASYSVSGPPKPGKSVATPCLHSHRSVECIVPVEGGTPTLVLLPSFRARDGRGIGLEIQ